MTDSDLSKPLIHTLIPPEIIQYWLEGRYSHSAHRSVKYNYLGWSLLMRGLYKYVIYGTDDETKNSVLDRWGYCLIDLHDGELYLGGVRLGKKPEEENQNELWEPSFRIWHSDLTKLDPGTTSCTLTFVYRYYEPVSKDARNGLTDMPVKSQEVNQIVEEWHPAGSKNNLLGKPTEPHLKQELETNVLKYLRDSFDRDWSTFESSMKSRSLAELNENDSQETSWTSRYGMVHSFEIKESGESGAADEQNANSIGDESVHQQHGFSFRGRYAGIDRVNRNNQIVFTRMTLDAK